MDSKMILQSSEMGGSEPASAQTFVPEQVAGSVFLTNYKRRAQKILTGSAAYIRNSRVIGGEGLQTRTALEGGDLDGVASDSNAGRLELTGVGASCCNATGCESCEPWNALSIGLVKTYE